MDDGRAHDVDALLGAAMAVAADRYTTQTLGVPSPTLMERASLCVAHEARHRLAGAAMPVLVLVGPGNNGGDGLAVARILHHWGHAVQVVLTTDKRVPATEEQLVLARAFGVPILDALPARPGRSMVVDGMLGTGSRGPPRGSIADALRAQVAIDGPRLAIDVPSGVDVDTGAVADPAFCADVTVTFVRSKVGLHVTPGRGHAGAVVIADIGIQLDPEAGVAGRLIGPAWVARTLAALPAGAHKGQRGHVAIVGGGAGTPGAAVLAATGAMRAGAGLATIVTGDPDVRAQLLAGRPELMVAPWAGMDDPLPAAQALVVGPGLTDRAAAAGLPALWAGDPRPALWDASALDHVPIAPVDQPRIITPHPGEAARMLARTPLAAGAARSDAWTAARVQSDRVAAARTLAAATGAITLLKGEGTVIATPAGEIRVCVTGGPALATAGSGDVLAGIGGAMLGRGLEPVAAAAVAVHAHGIAGDLAGARRPHPLALEIADSVGAAARACARRDVSSAPRWPRRRLG